MLLVLLLLMLQILLLVLLVVVSATVKDVCESAVQAQLLPNFGTRRRLMFIFSIRPFYPTERGSISNSVENLKPTALDYDVMYIFIVFYDKYYTRISHATAYSEMEPLSCRHWQCCISSFSYIYTSSLHRK
jgi:hypothetical protein